MDNNFNKLTTVSFQKKLRPSAIKIYQKIFLECNVIDLRENGVNVHILDKEFGIDSLIILKSGQWISIQEKYRENYLLHNQRLQVKPPYPDFTQEYKNAYKTKNEKDGEWFKLGAQLYFYGWSNKNNTDFEKWVLIDIPKYKLLVESKGGLDKVGQFKVNNKHGKAAFYAIPIIELSSTFIKTYKDLN